MSRPFVPYPFTPVRHAPSPPRAAEQRVPVTIVGAGPVGYCAAIALARLGVPVVLLEADDAVCTGSRAICISRRSLEILQRLGTLGAFLKIGLPWTGGRSFYRDTEVLHFEMPHDANQKLPPMINLAQYHIEQILLDRAEQMPELIDIRWQSRVERIDAREDGVTLHVSTPDGSYDLNSDWLIAADGARSTVRESLGLALHGTSYEGRYIIVDILLDSDRPTERLAYFDAACNPGSTVLVHKQPHGVWRIDYQLRDGEDPVAAVAPENVLPRVEALLDMMGERGAWSPIWITMYKAHALTLDRYRHARVLFAGDAAHLVPIFGVRGANSGIDDADNLAWKLALVLRDAASERLLDSYSDERVAAAQENLRQGAKSTEFMAPPSFAFDLMRSAVLSLAAEHPEVRSLINPRQTAAITYDNSPLHGAASDDDNWLGGPRPGMALPECPLTGCASGHADCGERHRHETTYVTDLLGAGFTLLRFGESMDDVIDAASSELTERFSKRGVTLTVVPIVRRAPEQSTDIGIAWDHTGRLFPMYDAERGAVYLVRPDGHVLARWRRPSASEVTAALDYALGREAHSQPTTLPLL